MTLIEYYNGAKSTLIDLGSLDLNLFHMKAGQFTECSEFIDQLKAHYAYSKPLDIVNLCEELGDFMWFTILERMEFYKDSSFTTVIDIDYLNESVDHQFSTNVIELLSVLMDKYNVLTPVAKIAIMMKIIQLHQSNITFQDIMFMNLEKLALRAKKKGKLSPYDAINRDLSEERKLLEEKFPLTKEAA